MKKLIKPALAVLAIALLLAVAGCSLSDSDRESGESSSAPAQSSDEAQGGQSAIKSAVVYFSWSGNTQQMAQWIADESGSDIYRVTPAEDYGTDYNACADRAKNELDKGIRPELINLPDARTIAQYDTLYIGFPVWWYDLPMPMAAFLESYDLSGKRIIPFFSHNGSSTGADSLNTLESLCSNALVLTQEALSLAGSRVDAAEGQIREWTRAVNS